jgi:hypothetical protein
MPRFDLDQSTVMAKMLTRDEARRKEDAGIRILILS